MNFVKFEDVDTTLLNDFYFKTSKEHQKKINSVKNNHDFVFFTINYVIYGYFFTYQYENKFKISFYCLDRIEKKYLCKIIEYINSEIISKFDRSFYIIEESEDSNPILDNFESIDASLMYKLTKEIKITDLNLNNNFDFKRESIPVHEYVELLSKCFYNDEIWDYSNFQDYVKDYNSDDSVKTYSCRRKNKLIGAITGIFDDKNLYINFIVTHPEYQNLGIAKRLFYELTKNEFYNEILIDVKSNNIAARELYKKLGFHFVKTSYIVVKTLKMRSDKI